MGASQGGDADPGTVVNATADPTETLQSFTLDDLAQFTLEQRCSDDGARISTCSTWDATTSTRF